jgi:hypothetical protein
MFKVSVVVPVSLKDRLKSSLFLSKSVMKRPGTPEAVIDAQLQTTNVEVVEIAVQGCVSVSLLKLLVSILLETLAEKVPHVSKNDQNQV